MNSFDQLLALNDEAKMACRSYMDKNKENMSVDEAFMDYLKSEEICKQIEDKMKKVEMRKEGSGYGYDLCAYYMGKDWLTSYQYSALLVFTAKLGKGLKQLAESRAEQEQKESLKQLIKQVIREELTEKDPKIIHVNKRTKLLTKKKVVR